MVTPGVEDRIRRERDLVSQTFIVVNDLVEQEIVAPGRRSHPAAAEAIVLLHRLGCLSFALEQRVRDLDALDAADGSREARAAEPVEVRFTSATGEPARDETMPSAAVVAAAQQLEQEIRAIVLQIGLGAEIAGRARRLRAEVAKLEDLVRDADGEGLNSAGETLHGGVADVLSRLEQAQGAPPDARTGDLLAAVDRAADEVIARRRALRRGCYNELAGRLEGYRQKSIDESRAERLDLEREYQAARQALRPHRFDLVAASRAVLAYQHAVNGAGR